MRILIIGGTGLISSEFARVCTERGDQLTLITRGHSVTAPAPAGAHVLHADATDAAAVRSLFKGARLRGEKWDAVVQFVAFGPRHVADDVETFAPLAHRYVLVATAAAYASYERFTPLREDTPQENDYWEYAREKQAAEVVLREHAERAGLAYTIVRPAHTYGDSKIPGYTGVSRHPWTLIDRMRRGADIIIPGDGTSVWTITHARDVAAAMRGLLDSAAAEGRAVHVTSDEALTWTGLHRAIAHAAGLSDDAFEEQVVNVPTAAILAALPSQRGSLYGDKMHGAVYDTSLIKKLVPGWSATIPFAEGVARAVAAFDARPDWQTIDAETNAVFDRLGRVYRDALRAAAT